MKHNVFKMILALPILVSCVSTIDQTIPLSNDFITHSKVITLDNHNWKIPDSIYNTKLGNYAITKAKTSWGTSERTLTDMKTDSSFINYLLFDDDLSFITEEFNVEETKQYSFNLVNNGLLISTSKCEIFSQSSAKQITSGSFEHSRKSSSGINNRHKTYLICAISHNHKQWKLVLSSKSKNNLSVELKSTDSVYKVEKVSKIISLVKNGENIEKRNSPPWLSLNSGLEFFQNNKQVSALSFVGKTKIWLSNDLATESEELLLSVNYSLAMFNWLDSDWRQ